MTFWMQIPRKNVLKNLTPIVQDMAFEKPSGLIKPWKAGFAILPDIQPCTSVDDFVSTCIIFGLIILFPLVWGYGYV